MASLTFQKDAQIYRMDVDPLTGTFVVGEFFVDTLDSSKLGEVIAFTDDTDGTGTIDYILVGSSATQFVTTDTFTGDGSGTGTVNGAPTGVGTHDVHVIQVDSPFTVVTIQDLVNQIREYEDELINLDHPKIIDASGKQDLGGGVLVGITLELLDNWRVQFEPRTGPLIESVAITGGNIVATNDYTDNAVKQSPFTQVTITSSSSATIATLEIIDLIHRIESLRSSHAGYGKIIYWNPTTGNDLFLGDSPDTATKTFAVAHTLAADEQGDVIFCLTKDATGIIETDEQLVITKNALNIRGPGEQFVLKHTTGSGPTVLIQANHVSFEKLSIIHVSGTATTGITIDGSVQGAEGCLIKDINIRTTNGDGISINDSGDSRIADCTLENVGDDGIHLGDNVDDLQIQHNLIDNATNHGVNVFGITMNTILAENVIHNCGDYGLRIGPNADQTIVRASNYLFDNVVGGILEEVGSTNTNIESLTDDQQLFGGSVHINIASGTAGTEFPLGTPNNAVNNILDARVIADNNGLTAYEIDGTITLTEDHTSWKFTGKTSQQHDSVLFAGFSVDDSSFANLKLSGTTSGLWSAIGCILSEVIGLSGVYDNCGLLGTNTIGATRNIALVHSYSLFAGTSKPTIDFNVGNTAIASIRDYAGGIEYTNMDQVGDVTTIDLLSGSVSISASCTNGVAVIRGMGELIDSSAGTTVVSTGLIGQLIQDNNDDPSIFV